jgi:hypothetical protein
MKTKILSLLILALYASSCTSTKTSDLKTTQTQVITKPFENGISAKIDFKTGKSFYYPLIVFWIEDMESKYIQTLYASKSIATSIFKYGVHKDGKWTEGERRRLAALPYWMYKRNIKSDTGLLIPSPTNPLVDAVTGATPQANFILSTNLPKDLKNFKVLMEINQTWDWNNYWHNNKYPDDAEYKASSQPALVYEVLVDLNSENSKYTFIPIGHSHPSGASGELYKDLSTLTTALEIVEVVTLEIEK